MSKKLFFVISVFVLAGFTTNLVAGDYNWTNGASDKMWTNPNNWAGVPIAVPTSANSDKAKVVLTSPDEVLITDGMTASCTWLVVGDNHSGEVHMTGGTLNILSPTGSDSWTIIAYAQTDTGIFTMDGGIVTTGNRVFVGFQGNGTLNMNGGTMTIGGTFGIGYGEGFTTGRGTVNLDGGTISVQPTGTTASFQMSTPAGCVGHLNITDGILILKGNCVTVVQGYVNNGYITAFNSLGDVIISYDGTNTTVRGQVNPYKARGPRPANSSQDVAPYTLLSWVSGDTTLTHDVYFGTDSSAVRDANTSTVGIYQGSQVRDANNFDPGALELGKAYYWRVDEVDDVNTYKGDVWQFTVAQFALIDDFESYADTTALQGSWSNDSTGATVSLATTGGHDKAKAMMLDYDNSNTPLYSEAQTGGPTADLTVAGVLAMDIWYKGSAANAAQPMYAALEDNDSHPVAVLVNSDPNAALVTEWTVWHIQLSDFAGVNLANVKKLCIGFGDRTSPVAGGAGTVYFDDIKLYPSRCLAAPEEDLDGDCVVSLSDFAIMASNWLQLSRI
jgi:hypothetical protein